MVIKLYYHGNKCAEIFVDDFVYSDVFSDSEVVGFMDGKIVCRFDASQYSVIKTDYGFEVDKVV